MKKKSGLGRGLSALLTDAPNKEDEAEQALARAQGQVQQIEVALLEPNPFQPRRHFDESALEELAESIRVQGVIQPVTVRSIGGGRYQLIAGERRWQASQRAGLSALPAYIRMANDQQMLEVALIENIQREDLNAMEIAISLEQLMREIGLNQEELSERVGKKRSTIANYLRLLKLPPSVQQSIEKGIISMGHAKALGGLEHAEEQIFIHNRIMRDQLSVRAAEELVKLMQNPPPSSQKKASPKLSAEFGDIQNRLGSHFGTKVEIKQQGQKGKINIPYHSMDDLNRVLDMLLG